MDIHDEANSQFSRFCERDTKNHYPTHRVHFCVFHGHQNQQLLFPATVSNYWFVEVFAKLRLSMIGPTRCTICFRLISISSPYIFRELICSSSGGTVYTTVYIYSASYKCSKHVEAINRNKLKANNASCWLYYTNILWCTVNKTLSLRSLAWLYPSVHMEHLGSHWTDFHDIRVFF
jgi:hypothetical protein